MKHILKCPICHPYSCLQDDVMNANDNAKYVAIVFGLKPYERENDN